MRDLAWKSYAEEQPPAGRFWWRVAPSYYSRWGGRRVEFVDVMRRRGNGHKPDIFSPGFDHWDGFRVTVPDGAEWAPADEDSIQRDPQAALLDHHHFHVPGLDLKSCPFCGKTPRIEWAGRWIGAPIWQVEHFSLKCCIPKIEFWRGDFDVLVNHWNTRHMMEKSA